MQVPCVLINKVGKRHLIDVISCKVGVEQVVRYRYLAVSIYGRIIILVVLIVTIYRVTHSGITYDRSGQAACSIEVIVDDRTVVISAIGLVGIGILGSHGTELTVDQEVVHYCHKRILLHIDATTLFSITAPSCIQNRVVVGISHHLSACLALTRRGELEAIGIGRKHDIASHIGLYSSLQVDSLTTSVTVGNKGIVADDGIAAHHIDTVRGTIADDGIGEDVFTLDIVCGHLRIHIISGCIDTGSGSR